MKRPLPPGTKITYCDMPGVVIHDDGGKRIEVEADGFRQRWYWKYQGIECQIEDSACAPEANEN